MEKTLTKNIRLGLFVLLGTGLLIYALYMIGSKRNLFGSTFRISAIFHNVNGLMAGNNVRFDGIDVGTVESVKILNDTSVKVTMVIEADVKKFIRNDALAGIGTDGLMGNKLVSINSVSNDAPVIKQNDTIKTVRPIEMDDMLRTLNRTNNNIATITDNLRTITGRVNSPNTLWSLLMDTIVADNVKEAIVNIKVTGKNSAQISGDLSSIVKSIKEGKGSVGAVLTDTSFSGELRQSVVNVKLISSRAATITGDMSNIIAKADSGNGMVGRLLMDTAFVPNLNKGMQNINNDTKGLGEVIEALKHSVFLRGYFKKQEKEKQKKIADTIHR